MSWINFRNWMEESKSMGNTQLPMLSVSASSSGRRGWDDGMEYPANTPVAKSDDWELYILEAMGKNMPEAESLLMGRWAYVEEGGFHSYHEWTIDMTVHVILNAELEAKIEDLMVEKNITGPEPFNKREYTQAQSNKAIFKYAGLKGAIQIVTKLTGWDGPEGYNIPSPSPVKPKIEKPKPGESSEKWWQDKIINPPGQPRMRYDPVTGKWERKWDGD